MLILKEEATMIHKLDLKSRKDEDTYSRMSPIKTIHWSCNCMQCKTVQSKLAYPWHSNLPYTTRCLRFAKIVHKSATCSAKSGAVLNLSITKYPTSAP
jgi:hypothetical protein